MYDECLCLGCKGKDDANQGSDGIHGIPNCLEDQGRKPKNNYEIVYRRGSYPNGEPRLQVNVNDSIQSWLDDDNINVNASFPKSFRCVISGPSECGKTFLLKNLFISSIHFDRLYIIGPTGNQYDDLKYEDAVFIKEIKELTPPDRLPENLKRLMIFDDVEPKQPIIKEYFCRGIHTNCNMIYLNQNLFSLDRRGVRENCNLFILFEQTSNELHPL